MSEKFEFSFSFSKKCEITCQKIEFCQIHNFFHSIFLFKGKKLVYAAIRRGFGGHGQL
jgi:hypothetical protein